MGVIRRVLASRSKPSVEVKRHRAFVEALFDETIAVVKLGRAARRPYRPTRLASLQTADQRLFASGIEEERRWPI